MFQQTEYLLSPNRELTWEERLDRADKTGRFTGKDAIRALDFDTCAVAELFGAGAQQEDESLENLGVRFYAWVEVGAYGRCRAYRWLGRKNARHVWNQLKAYKG